MMTSKRFCLSVSFLLSFGAWTGAHAQNAAQPKVLEGRIATELQEARRALSPDLNADLQADTFNSSTKKMCLSLLKDVAKISPPSQDPEAIKRKSEYLDQLLLLVGVLLDIDDGKRAMDCFGQYYLDYSKEIDRHLKDMPANTKNVIQRELKSFLRATGFKPRDPSSSTGTTVGHQ